MYVLTSHVFPVFITPCHGFLCVFRLGKLQYSYNYGIYIFLLLSINLGLYVSKFFFLYLALYVTSSILPCSIITLHSHVFLYVVCSYCLLYFMLWQLKYSFRGHRDDERLVNLHNCVTQRSLYDDRLDQIRLYSIVRTSTEYV